MRTARPMDYADASQDAHYLKYAIPDQLIVINRKRAGLITRYKQGVYYADVMVKIPPTEPTANETIVAVALTLFDSEIMPFAVSAFLKIEMAL